MDDTPTISRALPVPPANLCARLTPYRFCLLAIALFPFLQMGSSLFISVQGFLLLAIIAMLLARRITSGPAIVWLAMAGTSFMVSFALHADVAFNFSRELHFLLGGFVACWLLSPALELDRGRPEVERSARAMAIFLLASTILQQLLMATRTYLVVPLDFYVNSGDPALAARWIDHALVHGLDVHLRASAFFSEPSYLGLVATVLYYVQQVNHGRWLAVPWLIAFSTSVIAGTSLGLAANLILAGFFLSRRHLALVLIGLMSLFAVAFMAGSVSDIVGSRIQAMLSGNDQSTNVRVAFPLAILSLTWGTQIVGIPITGIEEALNHTGLFNINGESPLQNGIFNFLFSFGLMAIPLLALLLWRKTPLFILIFLIIGNQNGAFFELDKLVMYALTWIVTPRDTPFFLDRDDDDAPAPCSTNP